MQSDQLPRCLRESPGKIHLPRVHLNNDFSRKITSLQIMIETIAEVQNIMFYIKQI